MPLSVRQPENTSFLQSTKFALTFRRIPNLVYFLQAVNLPGVSTGEALQPTPFVDLYRPGDKIVYDTLNVTFLVDEDMRSWFELHDWIRGLTFPKSFDEYNRLKKENSDFGKIYSDATLSITRNSNLPNIRLRFADCFPTNLSTIQFNAMDSADMTLIADATFRFQYYEVERS
jgi:hypothetical protein